MQIVSIENQVNLSNDLNHNLRLHLSQLAKFESTAELVASPLYQKLKLEIERVLNTVVIENFASQTLSKKSVDRATAIAWNIERGIQFEGILNALQNHQDLREKDLYLLTEVDDGMARSQNLNVARELGQNLQLNYAFAPCYIALNKGSGVEAFVPGENTKSIHGLAIFSKFPIKNAHSIAIPNGKDKMLGKEKRLGSLRALVADIDHPLGLFRAAVIHLDAHSSRRHRVLQMQVLLDHLETLPDLPVIIGGDWNTTTHNSQNATRAILGYWRRIMMGPKNVAQNHYPHPQKYFERGLFELLEKRKFKFQDFNEMGVGTLHYDMNNLATNTNLGEWVPGWCFPFIRWATTRVGGTCSLKLDWFTGKNIKLATGSEPKVIGGLRNSEGAPLSDHDPIMLDFELS